MTPAYFSSFSILFIVLAVQHEKVFGFVPITSSKTVAVSDSRLNVVGQQAESIGPAELLRKAKASLPQIDWLAEGTPPAENKINMPDHVREVLSQPGAPVREAENEERTQRIRGRFEEAAKDAQALKGMCVGESDDNAWWRK